MAAPVGGGAGAKRIRDHADDDDDAQQPRAAAAAGYGAAAAAASAVRYQRAVQPANSMARILDLDALSIVLQHLDNQSFIRASNSSSQMREAGRKQSAHTGRELHMLVNDLHTFALPSEEDLAATPGMNRISIIRGTFDMRSTDHSEFSIRRDARIFMKNIHRFTHLYVKSIEELMSYAKPAYLVDNHGIGREAIARVVLPKDGLPLLQEFTLGLDMTAVGYVPIIVAVAPQLKVVRVGMHFRRDPNTIVVRSSADAVVSAYWQGSQVFYLTEVLESMAASRSCTVFEWAIRKLPLLSMYDVSGIVDAIKKTSLQVIKLQVVVTPATLAELTALLHPRIIEIHPNFVLTAEQGVELDKDTAEGQWELKQIEAAPFIRMVLSEAPAAAAGQ